MNKSNDSEGQTFNHTVSSVVYNFIGITMTVLFFLALLENILVLIVYKSNKKLQINTNLWIIAVIICDLLIVLNAFPLLIIASFAQTYVFGAAACKWDGFVVTVLGTSSIFLLTGLSVHRYIIMLFSARRKVNERTYIIFCIILCFCFGFFWGITPLIGWGSFALEGINISCAPDWRSQETTDFSYTISMYICALFLPLLTMAYCYISILFKIWREKRNHSTWIQQRRVKRDIKVTISVALTIVSFLVSWMPYAVVSLLESFFNMDLLTISPMLVQLPCLMAKTACIWNPLVYVCHNSQFREAFIQKFEILKKFTKESRVPESNVLGSSDSTCRVERKIKLSSAEKTDGKGSNSYLAKVCEKSTKAQSVKQSVLGKTRETNL